MTFYFRILFLLTLFHSAIVLSCQAQDSQYWTEQFGNRSTLLSGAVIGSANDLGVVFYNPARLAIQQNSSFLVSAKAYQQVSLKVKDGLGGKEDLSNQRVGPAPSLVAGSFNVKKVKWLKALHNHKFAYAFMSRYNFDYNFGGRTFQQYEYNLLWDGEEDLYASVNWNKSFKEEWVGVTWAIPIRDKWSIGITNFLTTTSLYNI